MKKKVISKIRKRHPEFISGSPHFGFSFKEILKRPALGRVQNDIRIFEAFFISGHLIHHGIDVHASSHGGKDHFITGVQLMVIQFTFDN